MSAEIKYTDEAKQLAEDLKTTSSRISNTSAVKLKIFAPGNKLTKVGSKTDFTRFDQFRTTFNDLAVLITQIESMAKLDADDVINMMTNYENLDAAQAESLKSLADGIIEGGNLAAAAAIAASDKAKASYIPADQFVPGTKEENMDYVASIAQRMWEKYHIYPSVLVAQALCETNCGTNGYTVERNNWFCIAAYDSNLDAAYDFPNVEAGVEAAMKNYWGGASPVYRDVITAKSPEEQMKAICRSGWASSHYGDASGSTGGNLKAAWDSYDLSKYDVGIKDYNPDMSKYGQ